MRTWTIVSLLLWLTACGNSQGGPAGTDLADLPGATQELTPDGNRSDSGDLPPQLDASDLSDVAATDAAGADGWVSLDHGSELDFGADESDLPMAPDGIDGGEVLPVHSAYGEFCGTSSDCAEGVCIGVALGNLCVPQCIDGHCPFGWQCFGNETPICVPPDKAACTACSEEGCPPSWCRTVGGEGPLCLAPCLKDGDCPAEFTCLKDEGAAHGLCEPDNGSCYCREQDMNSWVPCQRTNQFGTCKGNAMCLPEGGLQDCKAAVPAAEICDSVDNDCDGLTDELWPLLGKPCDGPDEDACHFGKYLCAADGISLECANDKNIPEKCNGLDDDCDGEVDEDFPGLGQSCGVSPVCGEGFTACKENGLGTYCKGIKPEMELCDGLDNDCDGLVDEGYKDSDGDGVADCVD